MAKTAFGKLTYWSCLSCEKWFAISKDYHVCHGKELRFHFLISHGKELTKVMPEVMFAS